MADIQYDTVVKWDPEMADVGYANADNKSVLKGLAISGTKITAGAPATVAGQWLPGAMVFNVIDGTWYQMTGSTASPAWTLNGTTTAGITSLTGDVTATGPGAAAATLADTVKVYHVKVSVSSAQILALNATPRVLVAAPGAGKVIVPIAVYGRMTFVTAAYDTNTTIQVQHTGAGTVLFSDNSLLTTTAGQVIQQIAMSGGNTTDLQSMVSNAALELNVLTGNPATGAGTLEIYVEYKIITL